LAAAASKVFDGSEDSAPRNIDGTMPPGWVEPAPAIERIFE
jgi:hypothetical protein